MLSDIEKQVMEIEKLVSLSWHFDIFYDIRYRLCHGGVGF